MLSPSLHLVMLTVQLWFLQLLLFTMSCFAVDGWAAIMYGVIAWMVSTPAVLLYPLLLRLLALLQRPGIGLLLLLAALMAMNDWLFVEVSAPSSASSMESPISFDFLEGDGMPIRICVHCATVLSIIGLHTPLTDYFQAPNPRQSNATNPADIALL